FLPRTPAASSTLLPEPPDPRRCSRPHPHLPHSQNASTSPAAQDITAMLPPAGSLPATGRARAKAGKWGLQGGRAQLEVRCGGLAAPWDCGAEGAAHREGRTWAQASRRVRVRVPAGP
ncbi:hypothetical protein P7K49_003016, partial [Saguinus oedipus]